MDKAMFYIYTKNGPSDYGHPKYTIFPEVPEHDLEGYTKELVDMNEYLYTLIKDRNDRAISILERFSGLSWHLNKEARKAYSEFMDSLNIVYPSFTNFLTKNPIIDADCCTNFSDCSHAFVYFEDTVSFKEQAFKDFSRVFNCKIKKYRNGNFEFLIDETLPESEQGKIHREINDFLAICAGYCSEKLYDKYIEEKPVI